jgi:hypothetical protein
MANREKTKCAHIPCLCDVAPGQEYYSEVSAGMLEATKSRSHANVTTQAAL